MDHPAAYRQCIQIGVMAVASALAIAAGGWECAASKRPQTVIGCLKVTGAVVSAIPAGFGDPPTIHLVHRSDTVGAEMVNVYLARSRKELAKVIRIEATNRKRPYKRAGHRVTVFHEDAHSTFARKVTACVRLPALGNYEALPG